MDTRLAERLFVLITSNMDRTYEEECNMAMDVFLEEEFDMGELKEETSIERNQVQLYQLHTYGAVHRDPRMRVVSVAHVALINQDVKVEAKDDADDAAWFEVQINDNTLTLYHAQHRMQYHMKTARSVNPDQEALAFDHIQMILDALSFLKLLPAA